MPRPRTLEGKTSIRIDLEGEEFEQFEIVRKHYGIRSNVDLVMMLLKREYDQIASKQGEKSYGQLVEFFDAHPELLERMGYQSIGQFIEALLKEKQQEAKVKAK